MPSGYTFIRPTISDLTKGDQVNVQIFTFENEESVIEYVDAVFSNNANVSKNEVFESIINRRFANDEVKAKFSAYVDALILKRDQGKSV